MGGVRMLYRHVDVLNANGFDAAIVHSTRGFEINWFEHSTHVLHSPIKLKRDDVAIFAEIGGLNIADSFAANRKVIFKRRRCPPGAVHASLSRPPRADRARRQPLRPRHLFSSGRDK